MTAPMHRPRPPAAPIEGTSARSVMPQAPIEIEPLWGHHDLVDLLAGWHAAEWGHLYPHDVWNEQIAREEFTAMADRTSVDMTWVAFVGAGRCDSDVAGSVSLVATDDLAGFEHLTPWLASLFVRPSNRGAGIAATLIDTALVAAGERGHPQVYLFTDGQEDFYRERGWSTLAGTGPVVMTRFTAPA